MTAGIDERIRPAAKSRGELVYRHSIWTRVTHWLWAVSILFLLMSGLSIFNARPDLYIGQQSGFGFDNAVLSIHAERTTDGGAIGVTTLFGHRFDTTGVLGLSNGPNGLEVRAFPSWATIPSYYDLATGRVIHFFFAWIFVATMLVWLVSALVGGHFRRDIVPNGRDIRSLPREIGTHLRLRFTHGRTYNPLQKLSYGFVLVILIPAVILTGLTLSPGFDAVLPWLTEIFGGRQTARTIHFACMALIVLFFVVHMVMVLAIGPFNALRAIVTGWYRVDADTVDGKD